MGAVERYCLEGFRERRKTNNSTDRTNLRHPAAETTHDDKRAIVYQQVCSSCAATGIQAMHVPASSHGCSSVNM